MKIGVLVLVYNVDRFLLQMLDNCGPHVDRIYASWSPVPWTAYNRDARAVFKNKTSPELLKRSSYYDKIVLITGEWADEVSQRNEALDRARADGMDFLIIQDADEFYTDSDYVANIEYMRRHPEADYFRGKWYMFWKTTEWVLELPGRAMANNETFAVNCRRPVCFVSNRRVGSDYRLAPVVPRPCCHLSWVYSDQEIWEKISTWGHADQVERERWFEIKWKGWTPASRCLSPIRPTPTLWKAVRFRGHLPSVLSNFASPDCQSVSRSFAQRVEESRVDCGEIILYVAKLIWGRLRTVAGVGCTPVSAPQSSE